MASIKKKVKKLTHPPFLIRTLSITARDAQILDRMAQDASDYLGWTISGSAIIRAFLRHAEGNDLHWEQEHLFPFIEEEIQAGRVWGKKKG
jgi:hypothetical protein